MKKIQILLLIYVTVGCTSPRTVTSEKEKYYIGMPISEFKQQNKKARYELKRAYDNVEIYWVLTNAFYGIEKYMLFEDGILRMIDTKVEKDPKIIIETKQSKTNE